MYIFAIIYGLDKGAPEEGQSGNCRVDVFCSLTSDEQLIKWFNHMGMKCRKDNSLL